MLISNLYFQIQSLMVILIIIFIYMSKPKIKTKETEIYKQLIYTGLIGVILDILSTYMAYIDVNNFLVIPLCKIYLLYLVYFTYLLGKYIFVVTFIKKIPKIVLLSYKIYSVIGSIIVLLLPIYNHVENEEIYTYGPSPTSVYIIVGINIFIYIVFLLKNRKDIILKKYYPIFTFIVLIAIASYIQNSNPEILIVTTMSIMVLLIMYFTIENPDIKMLQQVEVEKERADQANSAKSDFLSSMSHEIRTPLNAIVGFSKALEEEPNLSQEGHEEVKDIITASENLLEIVNGILDISKIEAEKLEIVNVEYKPRKIFDELISLTKSRIGEKPIHFTAKYDESMPAILYGDHTRMKQIILNLLTNAAKYTKEGTVNFSISSIKKDDVCRLVISVEDTGIGIKQENINKLFNKFERFDQEKNITIEGTGLGLAITKKLVELMNGKIVVQSVYGQGSKFTVAIDQRIISMELPQEIEELTMEDAKVTIAGKRVLIVDDNKINLKVVERLLRTFKLNIDLVDSGFLAIEKLQQGNTYDLILMDDMMPRMSGVETMKKIKTFPNFTTPMIALTANALTGMKEKYISEGFDDYLAKPIEKEKLEKAIKKYLSK